MPSKVVPEANKVDGALRCARCRQEGQFPRLIVDPATSRRFDFFECTACSYPNWIERKEQ
jgi:hypothetical protein